MPNKKNPKPDRKPSVMVDGRRITLKDLPLSVYLLKCGHYGRDYGIMLNDLIFCPTCKDTIKVVKVNS